MEKWQDYAASRKNHGHAPDPDLSQLAATSVVRSGVRASEYKVGIKQWPGRRRGVEG